MTIDPEDNIIFEDADFDRFSEPVKRALAGYVGNVKEYFAHLLNTEVKQAKSKHVRSISTEQRMASILQELAEADQATLEAAEPLLVQLASTLGVVVVPPPPELPELLK